MSHWSSVKLNAGLVGAACSLQANFLLSAFALACISFHFHVFALPRTPQTAATPGELIRWHLLH